MNNNLNYYNGKKNNLNKFKFYLCSLSRLPLKYQAKVVLDIPNSMYLIIGNSWKHI